MISHILTLLQLPPLKDASFNKYIRYSYVECSYAELVKKTSKILLRNSREKPKN